MSSSTRIEDVAQLAGVSRSTVSRAFSGTGSVSQHARSRVLKAAEQLKWQPNVFARGLRGAETRSLALLWSLHISRNREIRYLTHLAQQAGYMPHICDHMNDLPLLRNLLNELSLRHVDAVVIEAFDDILTDDIVARLASFRSTLCIVENPVTHVLSRPFDVIIRDREQATKDLVGHFVATGRRRPAMLQIGGSDNKYLLLQRELARCGIPCAMEQVGDNGGGEWHGEYEQLSRHVDSLIRDGRFMYDALYCGNDDTAVAVMSVLQKRGIRVPDDVAVVGHCDTAIAAGVQPALASVSLSEMDIANAVYRILEMRADDPDAASLREMIPMRFVWRESAG